MRHHRMRLALVAAVLMAAAAAHAQTMNSLSSPGSSGSTSNYVDPHYRFEEISKFKPSDTPNGSGLQLYVGPANTPTWGAGRFNGSPSGNVVGAPPDQSKFNDR